MHPIDYANASPDVALTSLHYYFPWAIRALVRWSAFCAVTRRRMRIFQDSRRYFEIGDDESLSYEEKLQRYRVLADEYFHADEYRAFCDEALPHAGGGDGRRSSIARVRRAARGRRALDLPGARARALRRRTTAACSAPGRGTSTPCAGAQTRMIVERGARRASHASRRLGRLRHPLVARARAGDRAAGQGLLGVRRTRHRLRPARGREPRRARRDLPLDGADPVVAARRRALGPRRASAAPTGRSGSPRSSCASTR